MHKQAWNKTYSCLAQVMRETRYFLVVEFHGEERYWPREEIRVVTDLSDMPEWMDAVHREDTVHV